MWTDEQALEALSAGVAADNQPDAGPEQASAAQTVTPAGETQQASTETMQAADPVATETQNIETFDGGKFNPDELPDELKPAWHQLQAEWTRKTQQLAEERKQYEALGDVDALQQAAELYSRLSDPNSWVQLHQELTEAMQQHGLTPAQAQAAATAEVERQQSEAAQSFNPDEIEDPELGAIVKQLQETQRRLDELSSTVTSEREAQQAEYQRQAFLGELQRQENAIRAAHPDWDDNKIEAVYTMSSFYNGDLMKASSHLESLLAAERELYLNQKTGVQESTGRLVPPASAGTQSQKVTEPQTLKEAEAEAIEFFKAQHAAYGGGD